MNDRNHDYDHALSLIKLLLTRVHRFSEKTCADKNFINGKGTFFSLINTSSQLNGFRPIINLWDGDKKNFIHHFKLKMTNLRLASSYLKDKIEAFHEVTQLEHLRNEASMIQ